MTTKRALVFDMDGTLVDNSAYHKQSWEIFCSKYNLPQFNLYKMFGNTNKEILSSLYGRELDDDEVHKLATEKELLYQKIYNHHIRPLPGLKDLLNALKSNNIRIALATSAPTINVEWVLKKTGTTSFFEEIVDDSQIKNGKPDPEIFIKAAEKLNLDPSQCIAVEDAVHGVKSAKAAGMKVIAITTTNSRENLKEADLIIDSFHELDLEIITRLFDK